MRARMVGVSPRGSSPRVRGKLVAVLAAHHHAGLIPACAGKTAAVLRPVVTAAAHPRVCGENAQ